MAKVYKNFQILKKGGFEEFLHVKILENEHVYQEQNTCIVDLDDIPDDPFIFTYPGVVFPIACTLQFLKDYVEKHPMFYLKKDPDSDAAISVPMKDATHIIRLPADTKVEDLIINGNNVLKIEKQDPKKVKEMFEQKMEERKELDQETIPTSEPNKTESPA